MQVMAQFTAQHLDFEHHASGDGMSSCARSVHCCSAPRKVVMPSWETISRWAAASCCTCARHRVPCQGGVVAQRCAGGPLALLAVDEGGTPIQAAPRCARVAGHVLGSCARGQRRPRPSRRDRQERMPPSRVCARQPRRRGALRPAARARCTSSARPAPATRLCLFS